MSVFCTNLRVPYDICVTHIRKNLHKNLNVKIISQKKPDMVSTVSLENMKELQIKEMSETDCGTHDCLMGTIEYDGDLYTFKTHHNTYDVILNMKKTNYPFDMLKVVLPITTYRADNKYENHENDTKIYIPEEFTDDKKIIPIEFIWEFLSQLPSFLIMISKIGMGDEDHLP